MIFSEVNIGFLDGIQHRLLGRPDKASKRASEHTHDTLLDERDDAT